MNSELRNTDPWDAAKRKQAGICVLRWIALFQFALP